MTAAAATGIAGLSVEDSTRDAENPLFDLELSVKRIAAARAAINKSGTRVLLTTRSEGFLVGRLTSARRAGAECLYAPGLQTMSDIRAIVQAVAPKPVNVLVGTDESSGRRSERQIKESTVIGKAGTNSFPSPWPYPARGTRHMG